MKKIATYIVSFCILFAGCVNDQPNTGSSSVLIRGNQIQCVGRAVEEITQFQTGDIVSLFSQGGIEAENAHLTYANGIWEHGGALEWNTSGEAAAYTAYYPSFDSEEWKYYDEDGFLKDIVYAHDEVSSGMFIELSFQHLFSKIIFEVDETLNEQIQSITFTPSVQVESVAPLTHKVALTGTPANSFQIKKQSNRIYSFFVPAVDEVTIDIQITTSEGGQLSSKTSSQSYESGYQYVYHLAPKVHEKGIYTEEDFIAFTHLINGSSYSGRNLDEFGEEVDGRMTYYLRNDLHFTEETSKEVQSIGMNSNKRFKACFDGQGHTISGLQIGLGNTTSYNGIFAYIGENGRVENLHVEKCSYINSKSILAGIIAGANYRGTIIGCHVKNCTMESSQSLRASGIVSYNTGSVFNSTVDDVQFVINSGTVGGLCNEHLGEIVNCSVTRCRFNYKNNSGGLCYNPSSDSSLLNCYVYSLDERNTNLGALIYKYNGGVMENCYCQEESTLVPICAQASYYQGKIYTYDSDFALIDTGEPLLDALNAWVEDNLQDYPLLYWQEGDENRPFIHQSSQ